VAPILLAMLAQATTPLAATGKWVIEGDNNMCALLRPFGDGGDKVTWGLRLWPLGENVDVVTFTQSMAMDVDRGNVQAAIDTAAPVSSTYVRFSVGHGQRLGSATFPASLLAALADAKQLTLAFERQKPIQLQLPDMKPGLKALDGCKALLLKSLSIDPAWEAQVATPAQPIGKERNWFSSDDYPSTAIEGGMQGTSQMLLTIGTDGRVARCVTFGSTGNKEMDAAACQGFQRKGRYSPARDKQGRPVLSYTSGLVSWVIPD